jgi:hypothetical protein
MLPPLHDDGVISRTGTQTFNVQVHCPPQFLQPSNLCLVVLAR